jgi:hypothetical protein
MLKKPVSELRSFSSLSRAKQTSMLRRQSTSLQQRPQRVIVRNPSHTSQASSARMSYDAGVGGPEASPLTPWSHEADTLGGADTTTHTIIVDDTTELDDSDLPFPGFVRTSFYYLHQTTWPRHLCIRLVNHPYVFPLTLLLSFLDPG